MKYIRRIILYLLSVITHFLLQSMMMLLSFVSKLIYFEDSFWSFGGILSVIFAGLYQILSFPFAWLFQTFGLTFVWFKDLPFVLNSLLWGWIIFLLIVTRAKHRHSRYKFVRGGSK